jgi:hypothetical protein
VALSAGDFATLAAAPGAWIVRSGAPLIAKSSGFVSSLASAGYQKLPSGLIVQWGIATNSSSADVNVTYPIAFPASLYSINITPQAATVGAFCAHNTQGLTSFNFSTWSAAATRATATPNHWIAIGK